MEEWPSSIEICDGRMFYESRLCIPSSLTAQVVRQHHSACGHPAPDRLWRDLKRRYAWGDENGAKRFSIAIPKLCLICQACEDPHYQVQTVQEPTPIPEHIFDSVSLDMFKMPLTKYDGKEYDCFVLCVDRLSGFINAFADREAGLTGKKLRKKCLKDGKW